MTASITWVHVGDLHADPADHWQGITRLDRIMAELEAIEDGIDLVFLPGDNANRATADQYRRIVKAVAPLRVPVLTIPGDHDFEDGTLAAFRDGTPETMRPFEREIAGYRCLFLDIVSAGSGGPDFRIGTGQRRRIEQALADSNDTGRVPLAFMHAFPSDLADEGEDFGGLFAEAGVAFVDTGHTHYNELLNDGRVVYGATRSTAQIEEDDGTPGYAIVCVHERLPSWTFRPIGAPWPHVQILSPADIRLVTRTHDPRHVPPPGPMEVVARVLGSATTPPVVDLGNASRPMTPASGLPATWHATIKVEAGLTPVTVRCGGSSDTVEVLVRNREDCPKRQPNPVAPGNAVHAIGAWPSRRILGTQLGPNRNGHAW